MNVFDIRLKLIFPNVSHFMYYLKYRAVFHLIWLLFVTTSRVSLSGMPSSLAELELCSNKASLCFAASESCLLASVLGPITCIIISKAPVRGRVQYSSNGRSFFKANLKKYYRLIFIVLISCNLCK